ncbi:YdeI/OmpD-associated family protein [Arcicella lustrica]|uniref:YdeI/OmpD-associated family protein n=1 Tax=Arcicella lustrica TaxID=2984196 RepID=A0ABU5SCU7_9BACT|nr:YdeI/OmpD-associated family protein [Arcicella sp. DC25W]MEA5425112.1 YdeI/OmpD-associated family protein [Arcicella sp. DC25W]
MEKPLIDKKYLLEKFPGKGGWTYAVIPEILQDKHAHFGWVKVKGFIDDFELKNYRLMPMGNGMLFLPVRAEIRKKIGKKDGDWVHVKLFADNDALEIPKELMLCLEDEPQALKNFLTYTESEQKAYIDWILGAKKEETKIERMAETVNKVLKGLKFRD